MDLALSYCDIKWLCPLVFPSPYTDGLDGLKLNVLHWDLNTSQDFSRVMSQESEAARCHQQLRMGAVRTTTRDFVFWVTLFLFFLMMYLSASPLPASLRDSRPTGGLWWTVVPPVFPPSIIPPFDLYFFPSSSPCSPAAYDKCHCSHPLINSISLAGTRR